MRIIGTRAFVSEEQAAVAEALRRDAIIQAAVDVVIESDTWCAFRVMPLAPGHAPRAAMFEQEATFSA